MNKGREVGQLLIKLKNAPCTDCGVCYPYYVMDFDHVPERGEKKFEISQAYGKYSAEELLSELIKCDLVCSNCHRERTHQRYLTRHNL